VGFFKETRTFMPAMYAIVDIETTGGNPKTDKITEIAVLVHDGFSVIKEFCTLINPECRISHHISSITGITNEMVADSPKFFEIAKELVEVTEDTVFVAHNVAFDYGFIRNEFRRLGYDFKREQLCTVRLSRKLLPGHKSYSLGKLCDDLQITINGRHRASGDAFATADLFNRLLEAESSAEFKYIKMAHRLVTEHHPSLDLAKIKNLPEEAGVYYFYNHENDLVYIGKSRNIKNRVLSHFSNSSTAKAIQMRSQIVDVGYEKTGSELIALLKESFEIKKHKPLYNRRQRRSIFRYAIRSFYDESGYLRLSLIKTTECNDSPLACFTSKTEALQFLDNIIEKYELCQKLCGRYKSDNQCFHYEIGACYGACIAKESVQSYNRRVHAFISNNKFEIMNMLVIDAGRNEDEKSVVKVEQGKYIGYGYFTPAFIEEDPDLLHHCITKQPDNREVQQIIQRYLRNNKVEKLIEY
jgi:DNA polymerase III subunit epsilon